MTNVRKQGKYKKPCPEMAEDGCTGCGICAKACPMDAIQMLEEGRRMIRVKIIPPRERIVPTGRPRLGELPDGATLRTRSGSYTAARWLQNCCLSPRAQRTNGFLFPRNCRMADVVAYFMLAQGDNISRTARFGRFFRDSGEKSNTGDGCLEEGFERILDQLYPDA
jgi:ferredoxin